MNAHKYTFITKNMSTINPVIMDMSRDVVPVLEIILNIEFSYKIEKTYGAIFSNSIGWP
jgi:hypothetical protein